MQDVRGRGRFKSQTPEEDKKKEPRMWENGRKTSNWGHILLAEHGLEPRT